MLGDYIPHASVASRRWLPTCAPPRPAPKPAPKPAVAVVSSVPVPAGPTGTLTNAQFIAASVPAAQLSQRQTRVPASVTIAQAILESGWGRSALSTFDNNFFGMKCSTKGVYAIGCRSHATSECTAAGVCYHTNASFRVYANAGASFADHGALLAGSARYRPAFNYTNDPNRFVAEIHRTGYATDPLYTVKLTNIIAKYGLARYDLR